MLARGRWTERLAEVDATVDHLEAQGPVGVVRRGIVDESVGGDLKAAAGAAPVFCSVHEGAADAAAAVLLQNKPALDETDRLGGIAAVGVGAEADFEKSDEGAGVVVRDEDGGGEGSVHAGRERGGELSSVFFDGALRPEEHAKGGELAQVCVLRRPDVDHGTLSIGRLKQF
ncbi:MAG TPA: hypothetical protein VMA34_04535 [Terracidiphilus sp.]|nr:hypothetical protein [Terracidiphilus sp.]